MANRSKFTTKRAERLLRAIEDACGNVSRACEACNISRRTVYQWIADDAEFREVFELAVERGIDGAEDEAHRRAVLGYEEPIVYQGKIQYTGRGANRKPATVRRFSDYLLARYMAAKRASWRVGRTEITGADGDPLQNNAVIVLPANGRGEGEGS